MNWLEIALLWVVRYWKDAERDRTFRILNIDQVDSMDGRTFEYYVAKLLQYQGFSTSVTKSSGDLGVDVVAKKGPLKYAVQVKHWSTPVSRKAVSDAVGARAHYGCNSAMVVTNNYFSNDAKLLARSNRCVLVDRNKLAEWIQDYRKLNQIGPEPKPSMSVVGTSTGRVRCLQCGRDNPVHYKFCRNCGSSLVSSQVVCASCGVANSPESVYCMACGNRFGHTGS